MVAYSKSGQRQSMVGCTTTMGIRGTRTSGGGARPQGFGPSVVSWRQPALSRRPARGRARPGAATSLYRFDGDTRRPSFPSASDRRLRSFYAGGTDPVDTSEDGALLVAELGANRSRSRARARRIERRPRLVGRPRRQFDPEGFPQGVVTIFADGAGRVDTYRRWLCNVGRRRLELAGRLGFGEK